MGKELDPRLIKLYHHIDELEQQERLTDLVPVYEECIKISLDVYGEYDDETLALYTEYGGLLRNLGRYEEALAILDKALKCVRTTKGTAHPDYAAALVNFANLLRMMHYDKESEALFLSAKKIYESLGATELFQYAGLCNNLGLLYQQMGRYEEAIPLHKLCLNLLKNNPEHEVLYGVTLNNLVEPYKAIG
ncbi:MAG: tetratricopeptide repeat protein, partial [Clostridiales bacterium]|nr:tetratricopeptide repeat protein [Clostridiales bacterium]